MKTLPDWIYIDGRTYRLFEEIMDDPVKGWHSFSYEDGKELIPPLVTDGKSKYYLVSCDPDRDTAYNDMLDRINNMKMIIV